MSSEYVSLFINVYLYFIHHVQLMVCVIKVLLAMHGVEGNGTKKCIIYYIMYFLYNNY